MIYFSNKKYREEVVTSAVLLIRLQKPKNNILFSFFFTSEYRSCCPFRPKKLLHVSISVPSFFVYVF
jgi:hypothetical protein